MESLVGSLRLSKSASTGATFVTAVENHGGEQTLIDDFDFYVGIDLAVEKHQACVVDRTGKVVEELAFEHSGAGLIDFIHSLEKLSGSLATRVGIVLETPRGPVVECALERGYSVFSINPKQLDRFRDRHCGWCKRRSTRGLCTRRFSSDGSAVIQAITAGGCTNYPFARALPA